MFPLRGAALRWFYITPTRWHYGWMKGLLALPVLLILLFGMPALADFEKGKDAYLRGDYTTALNEWLPLAEQGNSEAQYFLGVMYSMGYGVIEDYKAAIKWYSLAAELGSANAQYRMGLNFFDGVGVIQNYTLAHMWWNIAASQGDERAMANRDFVADKMTPSQIEKAQDLARECVAKNYKGC